MKTVHFLFITIITILFLILSSNFSFANFYEKGDTLNVWAVSGLNMREGPGTDFPKIKKLEYGDQIVVTDNYLQSSPLNLTVVKKNKKSDAFVLKGFWVRVKIGVQEGYVFDGYLSRFPTLAIKKIKEHRNETWKSESLYQYIEREIGFVENKSDTLNIELIQNSFIAKKGFTFNETIGKCYEANTVISDMTFQEAFLFINVLHRFEETLRLQKLNPEKFNWQVRKVLKRKGNTIFILGNDVWYATLIEKDGKILFSEEACC